MKNIPVFLMFILMLLTGLIPAAAQEDYAAETIHGEAAAVPAAAENFEELVVGNPTHLEGHFYTDMWGDNTADLDVRLLLHGYNLVTWDGEEGMFIFDPSVSNGLAEIDKENGDRTYYISLYSDLVYSDGTPILAADYIFSFLLQIAFRYLLNQPLGWTEEVTVLCWVWVVLWCAAFVLSNNDEIRFDMVKSNTDRVKFLEQFGWEVETSPSNEVVVKIPENFDAVMSAYNDVQKKQGLDHEKFAGKEAVRYTYKVKNFPGYDGVVTANIIVFKKCVIAGDICSSDVDGFIRELAFPEYAKEEKPEEANGVAESTPEETTPESAEN